MSNTTQVITPSLYINDEPTAHLNPGRDRPFAIVDLSPTIDLFIHDASHARAIAAAFVQAADLLDDYAASQAAPQNCPDCGTAVTPVEGTCPDCSWPAVKPPATSCPSCGTTLEPSGRCPACTAEPISGPLCGCCLCVCQNEANGPDGFCSQCRATRAAAGATS